MPNDPIIVCFGDSVTNGYGVGSTESFCYKLGGINAGVNNNDTSQGLERMQADVLTYNPDFVTIMFGIGDSYGIDPPESPPFRVPLPEYQRNIETMISLCFSVGATPVLMTPNLLLRLWENANMKAYVKVLRTIAERQLLPLIDVYQLYAETSFENDYLLPDLLQTDQVHPNALGHDYIYQAARKVIVGV